MKIIYIIHCLIVSIIIASCGKGVVDVTNESYEPKIVIDGILLANQKVNKIHIARNFRINENLRQANLIPDVNKTQVTITDIETGDIYPLTFHVPDDRKFDNYYWQYLEDDLIIEYGKSYRLDVSATIEGKNLTAYAITTVPGPGFKIASMNTESLVYLEHDKFGNLKIFKMEIDRSPGTTFYMVTIKAMNPTINTYIYDNPYEDIEPEDVLTDAEIYDYEYFQETPAYAGQTKIDILWDDFYFYGDYEIVVYAADNNYETFLQTYNDVQEPDGNYHEPRFNISGDGIGVFGSAIADTVYISVTRN